MDYKSPIVFIVEFLNMYLCDDGHWVQGIH